MKILFLLFPLILLLVQDAAGEKGRGEMGESVSTQGGFCTFWGCRHPAVHFVGMCPPFQYCCRR
uniref:Uncharacterized protein n=1 Tax=Catharus ustulatus TaxID=91951 RepID=A0A8C3U5V7_CATUS